MRASVLLILVLGVLGIVSAAHAQIPIPNTFSDPSAPLEPDYPPIDPTDPSLRGERIVSIDDGRPSIAIGNQWRLESQSESHYPIPAMKSRDEGVYLARPVTEHWSLQLGAWRSKLQWTGNETSLRSSYVGFRFSRTCC